MGWNNGYTIMEATVIAAYDAGLRGEQLAPFLEPYCGSDIDSGGSRNLKSKDGKGVEQIVVEAFGTPAQVEAMKKSINPPDNVDEDEAEAIFDAAYSAFSSITEARFGW